VNQVDRTASGPSAAAPAQVRFEHHIPGRVVLGIGTSAPRLSWQVPSADAGFRQGAYEVEVTRGEGEAELVRVSSSEQVLVPWPAKPLASREAVSVRVRVRHGSQDDPGAWSGWSAPAVAEAGLLDVRDWRARFVSPRSFGRIGGRAPVIVTSLHLDQPVMRARLYATAHGLYAANMNGVRVGDEVLAPGWTSYSHRLRYQSYDVTELLREGDNTIEVVLGNGWYRGRLGWSGKRGLYGERLALLAQLEVTTADGATHLLATDETWTARESGIVADDIYDGQRSDLRIAHLGDPAGPQDHVEVLEADLSRLVAPDGPPVRVTEIVPAARVFTAPSGETLVDFGQNLVGWVRLRVRGQEQGREVVVRHAEVLEHGELGVRPLRSAKATDSYILSGDSEEVLEPAFTFHGFRYAGVTGVTDLAAGDVEAVVVGSDMLRTGWFSSSHPLLDRFHDNVVWAMRGNFVDVPTDCPQRDERLGWTGDIQVFSPTANFLFDCAGLLSSWLADLAADQDDNGTVPFVIPDILPGPHPAAAAWGDAATVVPWVLYQRSGDAELLARQLPSMRRWVDRLAELAGPDHLWTGGFQFGDWLDPTAPPDDPFLAKADPDVVATAHFARSAEILGEAAAVLGDEDSAQRYQSLAASVREAFVREYVTPGGRVLSEAPTAYALALAWALLSDADQRCGAGRRLADLVRCSGFRISTGFVGTPLVTDALASSGHVDIAYRLLLQESCPSWLYPVTMGATTIWERWDSMLPDGSINPGEMTSFNHYALGAVADWLHRSVAGLAPGAPGYRKLVVRPLPGGGLSFAKARHLTPYGEAAVSWERAEGSFHLSLDVPVGASAEVHLPGAEEPISVGHGHHSWDVAEPTPPTLPAGSELTVRDVFDREEIWDAVVSAVLDSGLASSDLDLAGRLGRYLDRPAAEIALAVARDSPTAREALRSKLEARLGSQAS